MDPKSHDQNVSVTSFFYTVSAKIVANIKFDYKNTKKMDVRQLVKIKRLPGGDFEDCEIVKGEVFSGRVARIGMPLAFSKPRMLLIQDSLCFPRIDKLVSMENLAAKLEEYDKNVTDKLLSFRPDLIVAEKAVSQGIIDALSEKGGITLILKVKPQVVLRLHRLFEVIIITSLDSTVEPPDPGSCIKFSNENVILEHKKLSSKKSLIRFEGVTLERGCAILLRGRNLEGTGKSQEGLASNVVVEGEREVRESVPFDGIRPNIQLQTGRLQKVRFYGVDLEPLREHHQKRRPIRKG